MSRGVLARKPVGKLRHSYVSTNVTTGSWVALSTTVPAAAAAMEIFDSSGRVLKVSYDNGATEEPYYIIPGGSDVLFPIEIAKGRTIYLKAVDNDATTGQLVINFFAG